MSQPVVVGMFRNPRMISKIARQNPPLPAVLNMNAAEASGVTAYFFSINDIRLRTNQIWGWMRKENGVWVRKRVPWPDVVYDRFVRILSSEQETVRRVRQKLQEQAISINSCNHLTKSTSYFTLRTCPEVRGLLPETRLYTLPSDITQLLSKHPFILAKPLVGRSGNGISRIWSDEQDTYGWESATTGEKLRGLSLFHLLGKIVETTRGKRFLVQQQVELAKVNGNRFDIRVLMCKDEHGVWQDMQNHMWVFDPVREDVWVRAECTAIALAEGLQKIAPPAEAEALYANIITAARLIVEKIEQRVGPMGEIGLDFAVDRDLKLWFLEANAMPEKDPEPCDPVDTIPRQFLACFAYAKYLRTTQS